MPAVILIIDALNGMTVCAGRGIIVTVLK